MRKFIFLLTVFSAFLLSQTAYTSQIEMWSSLCGSKEAARLDMFERWKKAEPNIEMKHLAVCSILDQNQKVITSLATGNPPELISNHYYFLPQYAALDALTPLDECLKKTGIDPSSTFLSTTYDLNVFDGKLYGLPLFNTSRVLLYNKDLMREAGVDPNSPPRNWYELADMAKRLTKRNSDGSLNISGFWARDETVSSEMPKNLFYQLLWSAGGEIMNKDRTKVIYNSEAGYKALKFYADLINVHKVYDIGFGSGTKGGESPFYKNKAVMLMGGPFDLVHIDRYRPDMDFGVTLLPAPSAGTSVPLIDSFAIMQMASAKNQEGACKFVQFAASKEAQVAFSKLSRRLPAHLEAVDLPEFKNDPVLNVFTEALNKGRALPIIPEWAEMEAVLITEIQKTLMGKKSPRKALNDAAKKVNNQVL